MIEEPTTQPTEQVFLVDYEALEMACTPGNRQVSTYLASVDYAALVALARQDERGLSEYVRRLIRQDIARRAYIKSAAKKVVPFHHRRS